MSYFWQNWLNNQVVKRAKSLFVVSRPLKIDGFIKWVNCFSFNEGGKWLSLCIWWPSTPGEEWFFYLSIGHYQVGFLPWSYHG